MHFSRNDQTAHVPRRGRPCGRCSLCGGTLLCGEQGWYLNGQSVCADCFPALARAELAPYEITFGTEEGER